MLTRFALPIGLILVLGVSLAACGSDPTNTSAISTLTPATSVGQAPAGAPPTPTPKPAPTVVVGTSAHPPTVMGVVAIPTDHMGKATASIEERVYLSDVVVRARFVSAASTTLTFRATDYMKGTGPDNFSVKAITAGRDTRWDNQDAILFLNNLSGKAADFEFADTTDWDYPANLVNYPAPVGPTEYTGTLAEGYTLGTRNPVWLPVGGDSGNSARSASQSAGSDIVTEYDSSGTPRTVSQQDLQETISWIGGSPSGNIGDSATKNTGGATVKNTTQATTTAFTPRDFNICIGSALRFIRDQRDREAYGNPYTTSRHEYTLGSGVGKGTTIFSHEISGASENMTTFYTYRNYMVNGADAGLFDAYTADDDGNPYTGYRRELAIKRPLPNGTYEIEFHGQSFAWIPCNYMPESNYGIILVNVEAPTGTVHEAFFDPATTTAGRGVPRLRHGDDHGGAEAGGVLGER